MSSTGFQEPRPPVPRPPVRPPFDRERRRQRMPTQPALPTVPEAAESPDDSPQRRRLPPDERRSEIFQAALAVFSELGYDRATLSDLVERVGVSKGCLYHH